MPRKKKKNYDDYDSYEEYEDDQEAMTEPATEARQTSLDDYVIKEKVQAFVTTYEPCDEFDPFAERFDDAALRIYFKAWVCPFGDPLHLYVEDLKFASFHMVTSVANDRPCIFARRKQ